MDERKGYQFLLALAKDATASDSDPRAAIEQLELLGDSNTLDELIALANEPSVHNIKPTIIVTVSKLQHRLDQANKEVKPRRKKDKDDG